jgi:nucleotide-binding universal stress UspA family protein
MTTASRLQSPLDAIAPPAPIDVCKTLAALEETMSAAPHVYSAGPAAEPLLEPSGDPSELLAAAKATVRARAPLADVVVVAREGDPAEELLDVARAASADLVIIGRRGAFAAWSRATAPRMCSRSGTASR